MSKNQDECEIVIVETSDLHGALLPIRYADNGPAELGLAKIATLVRAERARGGNVIFVDNGDLIQGTPLAYHHARLDPEPTDPMVTALGALGCDAAVVGNHEFNYGMGVLRKAMRESPFPWLSATVVDAATGEPAFGRPYIVKETDEGVKVGILGLTTPYIPNWEQPEHIAGLSFVDAVEAARRWVPVLREREGADVVVISYHGGFERDLESGEPTEPLTGENQGYQLCTEVPGIDVLLTGHQHRQIAGASVGGVTVVQPGTAGAALGKVSLRLVREDGKWHIAEKSSQLVSVEGAEPDRELLALVEPYEAKTQKWLDTPMGRLQGDMRVTDPMKVRLRDNALIEFINRVQMEVSGAEISNTALFDNVSPGFPPDITMRHIVANYIYPNTLKVIRITGQDIRDALEKSAEYFALDASGEIVVNPSFLAPKPQHYNYDMWEGIEYKLNVSRPAGQRVVQLTFRGQPLDPAAEYDVVMNNYRAGGGGNYFMFQGKQVVRDIPTDVAELIANYILEKGTIEAAVDGNWEVVTD
ncbi:2', 3'-cyclic nucleotide 2'-phosphodiesterase [Gordoniibacillus kamchatkensis]|uniref:2', 3'-cyclic nucleotide 2'-phosphodiesterase n=1 Tax=Gordoniibacillus kamchatkensis TaxID=1590651 RepID=A0ABR5ADP5_9BACL|nr:bifunctional metallophosphatase/5'-nucleotidase [Paenibacillus sp. VKM B-2647]KIL39176.1 2', 3'-cyclic nucleotide 2'-phosphodiesterase [Paenibacillus sp. VKM B-2647]